MIRGGSTGFKLPLPCRCQDVSKITFVCGQTNNSGPSANRPLPIVKVLSQCQMQQDPPCLIIRLNREETMRFSDDRKAYVQFAGETKDGSPIICRKQYINVYPLEHGDIFDSDIVIPTPTPGQDFISLDGAAIPIVEPLGEALVYLDGATIGQRGDLSGRY